jgi:serine/threonine protein kinase/WD40 repeat protein
MAKPAFKRVEELFHQASALRPTERTPFLDATCAGDGELRAAVEELLEHDQESAETINSRVGPVAGEAERFASEAPTRLDIHDGVAPSKPPTLPHIPGYEILSELGRGGMGVVYKARQTSLNRIVALKMLLQADSVAPEQLRRFRSEAEVLARLHHPNIVTIYEINEYEGHSYFTMEFVAGSSLAEALGGRPQDVHAAAWLIEVVARAVHAVHQAGVIHRDLKPANILLQEVDSRQHAVDSRKSSSSLLSTVYCLLSTCPKITDFGVAKDQAIGKKLTRTGSAMGTPCYMAPEQVRGTGVGPAADIYALGSILYEMLTGRPPFDSESSILTVAQLLHDEPLPPSRLRPRLPRDIATICVKCLEKSPSQRYASALELADDLKRFQSGEVIEARPIRSIGRIYRWGRRKPQVAGLLALVSALVIAFVVTVVAFYFRLQEEVHKERSQVIKLNIILGEREREGGDDLAALLRFTEALRLEQLFSQPQDGERVRVGQILRRCPRLVRLLSLGETVLCENLTRGGGQVVTIDNDGLVQVRHVLEEPPVASKVFFPEPVLDGWLSADGRVLAVIGAAGTVMVHDPRAAQAFTLPNVRNVLHSAIHPGGNVLVTQHPNSTFRVWNLTTHRAADWASPASVAFSTPSENARWLFTVDKQRLGHVRDLSIGKPVSVPLKLDRDVSHGAVSPDGGRVAVVDVAGTLTVWDARTGRLLGKPVPYQQGVSHLLFSPGGERLFMAGSTSTGVWNAQSGEMLMYLHSPEGDTAEGRFSPDGRLLMVARAGAVQVRDAETGEPMSPLLRHGGAKVRAGFSPDGKRAVLVGQQGLVCIWELPLAAESGGDVAADSKSVEELVSLARMLSCSMIDESEQSKPLEPEVALGLKR